MADQQSIPPLQDDSGRRAVMVPVMHHPGRHCASTGICNLMNFHGIKWSEALCFGIGAGLGIWYLDLAGPSPSRLVHVRSADIEQQFFRQIGCASDWEEFDDPEEAEQALCTRLEQGRPAIIRTDIFHLPYYGSSTHFPGHVITVWGYHEAKRVFFLTDTEREELLEVGFEDLSSARFSSGGLFDMKGNMLAPGTLPVPDDMPGRA